MNEKFHDYQRISLSPWHYRCKFQRHCASHERLAPECWKTFHHVVISIRPRERELTNLEAIAAMQFESSTGNVRSQNSPNNSSYERNVNSEPRCSKNVWIKCGISVGWGHWGCSGSNRCTERELCWCGDERALWSGWAWPVLMKP